MIAPSTKELASGFKEVIAGLLSEAKVDAVEILPVAQEIANRAAFWGEKLIAGDPSADQELILVQAQMEAVLARVYRQSTQQLVAKIMQGFGLVMKFVIGAAAAL